MFSDIIVWLTREQYGAILLPVQYVILFQLATLPRTFLITGPQAEVSILPVTWSCLSSIWLPLQLVTRPQREAREHTPPSWSAFTFRDTWETSLFRSQYTGGLPSTGDLLFILFVFDVQVYGPCILLVVISWVSFWLNREATSDRISLGEAQWYF